MLGDAAGEPRAQVVAARELVQLELAGVGLDLLLDLGDRDVVHGLAGAEAQPLRCLAARDEHDVRAAVDEEVRVHGQHVVHSAGARQVSQLPVALVPAHGAE